MLLSDGVNVTRRNRPERAPQTTPEPSPTVSGPEIPEQTFGERLEALTVPEVRHLLDDGTLDPWEVIEHEQAGKGRLGILNLASEMVGLR